MITKQGIDVSFAEGLDTKTDKKRVKMGKFVVLENTVFQKGGLLQKRNGYAKLAPLPDSTYSYLTTLNDNLTAIGQNIAAYNAAGGSWVSRGSIQPVSAATLPLIRNNLNQTAVDAAVAPNGLVCTVYLETDGSTTTAKYAVANATTGQNIVAPAAIPVASGVVTGGMRVFYLGTNFVIVFTNVIAAVSHLQYVTVNSFTPTVVSANTDLAAAYVSATTLAWDAYVVGTTLFFAYNTTTGGQAVKVNTLTSSLVVGTAVSFATYKATMVSVTADMTSAVAPVIYVSFYRSDTSLGYTLALNTSLGTLLAPVQIVASGTILNITSAALSGICAVYLEVSNAYAYDGSIATNYIDLNVVTLASGTAGGRNVLIRSVGLASKAFIVSGVIYLVGAYQSTYQPTYFLINGTTSTEFAPVLAGKLAYQNGGGYLTTGLPGVTITGTAAQFGYRYKDLIQAVNKNTAVPAGNQTAGIYSQTGLNLGTFDFGTANLDAAEIGGDLHLSGGFLWMYDGYLPVEHNFLLYPDSVEVTTATGAGSLSAQDYYYQAVYEWTDNQGNAFRSAPSIPVKQTTTTASSTNTIKVPTLRLTMKTANKVKVVLYRWSTAQQNYYQTTSISSPTLNDPSVDYVTIVDAAADATILGNNLIYTTGGVVEDVNAPASNLLALFDTRLWLVDAEDPNVLWFSKQVIEATPVEMSDLFTMYVPPTTATQGTTGPMTSIAAMDDKLIIGKRNAFLYINGTGPDNTGANNQYSQPIFITSTVGCTNQKSIVLMPDGLMFQSDKGIWLLSRGLETSYIGAPAEDFTTGATVLSAVNVPETNQVRFTLDTGITLMYDYYYGQWGTFTGVPAVSSCIYQNAHAFINDDGDAYQETAGTYVDGSRPVLIRFKTGPLRLGDLQGYQRAFFFYILGEYLSPHKLVVSMAYDYDDNPSQSIVISPVNYNPPYGSGASQSPYGQGNPYGGPSSSEDWRIFFERQRCMAFSIMIEEIFDASFGVAPGAGLTLSGLNVVMGFKSPFRPQPAAITAG